MSGLDIFIIIAFLLYAISSGIRSSKIASKNLDEYFLAGRSLTGWKAGVSMAATQFAADTPLLVMGLIATSGIFALWRLWIYALAFLLMGFLLAACWRRAGVLTDAEFTEFRYQGRAAAILRAFKSVYFGIVFNCTVLAMVMLAATRIAEPFLIWNEWLPQWLFAIPLFFVKALGVPFTLLDLTGDHLWVISTNNIISIVVLAGVTLFYSTAGGLRTVVRTDLVQFSISILATLVFAVVLIAEVGGLGGLYEQLQNLYALANANLTVDQLLAFEWSQAKDVSIFLLLVFAIQWIAQINADGTGYLAQRSMACKSDRDARVAAVVFTVAQIFLRSLIWIGIGLGLLVVYPPNFNVDSLAFTAIREATFITGMVENLPSGIRGLMITGMLAALLSTVDTHLNWGSSYLTNDIYKRFLCRNNEASDRSLVWVARFSNFIILIVSFIIMANLESIQQAWKLSLLLGGGMGIILVLRWVWWRINAWGELSCAIACAIMAPFAIFLISDDYDAARLLGVTFLATAVAIVVSLWKGPEPKAILEKFYKRVQPPGFWKKVAQESGEDERLPTLKLKRGLTLMFSCAFSIFFLLTGIGSLLFHGTPPTWFPIKWLWEVILILAGSALVPFWWHGLRHPKEKILG